MQVKLDDRDSLPPSSTILSPPCVPFFPCAEITHLGKPPTLRKESVMKLVSSLNGAVSESPVCSLIEPGPGSSANCRLDGLFHSFPFNYDILTANFALKGEKGIEITRDGFRKSNSLSCLVQDGAINKIGSETCEGTGTPVSGKMGSY